MQPVVFVRAITKSEFSKSIKEDLIMWQTSLSNYNGVTVMLDTAWTSADSIECFTDSAGGKQRGTSKLAKRVG
jgi:hypothetical protein